MYTNFHWIGGRGLGALQTLDSVLLSYVVNTSKVRKIQPKFVMLRGRSLQSNESLCTLPTSLGLSAIILWNKIRPQPLCSLSNLHLLFLARNEKMTSNEAGVRLSSGFGV